MARRMGASGMSGAAAADGTLAATPGAVGVGAAGEGGVVRHVAGGFVGGHAGEFAAQRDALVERGEHPEFHALAEGGLANEEAREW